MDKGSGSGFSRIWIRIQVAQKDRIRPDPDPQHLLKAPIMPRIVKFLNITIHMYIGSILLHNNYGYKIIDIKKCRLFLRFILWKRTFYRVQYFIVNWCNFLK